MLRYADEFTETPAVQLRQLATYCKCSNGEAMSLDQPECQRAYQAIGESWTHQFAAGQRIEYRVSPLSIQLNQMELEFMRKAIEVQLVLSREIFQQISSAKGSINVSNLLKDLDLPRSYEGDVNRLLEAALLHGPQISPLFRDNSLADYPFFSGIHASVWRSGFDEISPDTFAVWPLSTRRLHQSIAPKILSGGDKSAPIGSIGPAAQNFAQSLRASALEWTGDSGEVVILLAGGRTTFNESEQFLAQSGLTTVSIRQLRQGEDGSLYYESPLTKELKRVNGVYSPDGDDALLQWGATEGANFRPMYQQFVDNQMLANKINRNLLTAVWYDYIFDANSLPIGIKADKNARPLLWRGVYSGHPTVTESERIDFKSALINRKVYIGSLGQAALRHPVVTHVLNRLGNYKACTSATSGDTKPCSKHLNNLSISNLQPLATYRVDLVDEAGRRQRYDFGSMPAEARVETLNFLKSERPKRERHLITQRIRPLIAKDLIDGGNGELAVIDRVVALRTFATLDARGRAVLFPELITANMAPVSGDDVGHGNDGPVFAIIETLAEASSGAAAVASRAEIEK